MAGEKNAGSIVYEISADVEPLLQGDSLEKSWRIVFVLSTTLLLLSLMVNPFNEDRSLTALLLRGVSLAGAVLCFAILSFSLQQVMRQRQLNARLAITRELHEIESQHYGRHDRSSQP